MIDAEVEGRPQELVLDSGAPVLVLFRQSAPSSASMLLTNTGRTGAHLRSARVRIGSMFTRRFQTAEVNAPPASGLLPTRDFASVYISNRDGIAVLVP